MAACSPFGRRTCGPSPACSRPRLRRCAVASTSSAFASEFMVRSGPSTAASELLTPAAPLFGVYVHIPFCQRRCDYCAFATWTDRHHLTSAYADACRTELARAALQAADTVFFGS